MTHSARRVLERCKIALEMLEEFEDEDRWHVTWVGAIGLLRSVGHVLKEVDGKNSAELNRKIRKQFDEHRKDKEKHKIFWDFIQRERNLVLKEDDSKVENLDSIALAAFVEANAEVHSIPGVLYHPIVEGPWQGEDARDVYEQAMEWWDQQLTDLERKA